MRTTTAKKIHLLSFWKIWPNLSPEILAFLELEQDDYFAFVSAEQTIEWIEAAMQYGKEISERYPPYQNLTKLCNQLLADGIRIQFRPSHPNGEWIRAQYYPRSSTIEIYHSSLNQLRSFFAQQCFEPVEEEDLIAMHLYHEWFHYLEEKKFGRTDLLLPKVTVKQWGPFTLKKSLSRTREIAAHTFTQKILQLPWSPLLLDQLLLLRHEGWNRGQIREHFKQIRQCFAKIQQTSKPAEKQA